MQSDAWGRHFQEIILEQLGIQVGRKNEHWTFPYPIYKIQFRPYLKANIKKLLGEISQEELHQCGTKMSQR